MVRIGGSGYSVLTRDAAGLFGFEANERCSAGTGETIEGLCSRLGCSLDEAIALAGEADESVAVTSRCAVFAKSELTHFANQGVPHGRLFRGVFDGVARNVHSLYDKQKVPGRVLAVGHGALIAPVVETFTRLAGVPVEVARRGRRVRGDRRPRVRSTAGVAKASTWPADPAALVKPPEHRVRALAPAADGPGSVVRLEDGNGSAAATGSGVSRARRSVDPHPVVACADAPPSSASTWARPGPRRRCSTSPPVSCSPTSTGAPTATPSRPPRRWSPSCAR